MTLLIFQIIVAWLSFMGLLILSVSLFFLLKTYGYNKSVAFRAIVLTLLLIANLINLIVSGYLGNGGFAFFEICCALLSFLTGGYIFNRLPVGMSVRSKIRTLLVLEPLQQPAGLCRKGKDTDIPLPEKSASNLLTVKQKEKLEEILHTPAVFCNEKFTAKEFAKQVGTNVSYLNRYLKQQVGLTGSEYIISRRLDEAEKILAETDLSVLDVCDSVGFKSPTSLFDLFKKRHGMSPLQWRQHNKKDNTIR